jgi:hypothetical protein
LDIVDEHFISIICSPKHAACHKHFLCHQAKELSGQPTHINSSFTVAFIISKFNTFLFVENFANSNHNINTMYMLIACKNCAGGNYLTVSVLFQKAC